MRHRYIFCGLLEDHKISSFRLIANTKYSGGQLVRVNIPDDLKLYSYPYDGYSTTDDNRTIDDLGYDCYILFNWKWRKFNWLKNLEPHSWFRALEHIFGLQDCYDTIGWTDNYDYYKEWWHTERIPEFYGGGRKYPVFREDKKGLKLKVKLDPDDSIQFLRNGAGEDVWLKYYDEFKKELENSPDKEIWCT